MSSLTFESGQYYTLSQIFTGDNKIIIPDLQRDYCWGNNVWNDKGEKISELVSGFVNNLISLFIDKPDDKVTMGLIYGYENPHHHIQLCDGQQRITTLFLLLGMINKTTNNNFFQENIISKNELDFDDKEPYLQYSIRESTLYFLSDLVCEFFLKKTVSIDNIKKQDWYFDEYELDASIQSMLSAIEIIESILNKQSPSINIQKFGEFILNNLQLIYYDMGNRLRGEETFVVINTTGEPLTASENLKPILIGNIKDKMEQKRVSNEWEEREDWYWQKRKGAGNKTNQTSDNGIREFYRWIAILLSDKNSKTFKSEIDKIRTSDNFDFIDKNIDLTSIHKYFHVVQFLFCENGLFKNNFDWLSPDDDKHINSQIVWFRLLPVIEYVYRFGVEIDQRKIIRVKTFFKNLSRIENVSKAVGDLLFDAIQIIKKLPNDDIASILKLKNISSQIISEEERIKFELFKRIDIDRIELEDRFWKEEDHKIWNGEILPLIKWSKIDNEFNVERFDKLTKMFSTLFHENCDYAELDLVRRALLTRNLIEYPKIFKGDTNWSFCWDFSNWKTLIVENEEEIGSFIDELSQENYTFQLNQMIDNYPEGNAFYEFVKNPELLKYCTQKNIQKDWDSDSWVLVKKEKTSGDHANHKIYILFLEIKDNPIWNTKLWGQLKLYQEEKTCVYLDNIENITVDIKYNGNELYCIKLFRKNKIPAKDYKLQLLEIAKKYSLEWNEKDESYNSTNMKKDDLKVFLKAFLNDSNYIYSK